MADLRLVTLNPGHFHAALVQKDTIPGVDRRVHVYAPLDGDLLAHLQRLVGFNTRKTNATNWEVEVHAGEMPLERLIQEKPGEILILAGRSRPKIEAILAGIKAGMHVLADKPWILVPEDLPKLKEALEEADRRGVIAYDIMTERFEITSLIQQALLQSPEILGTMVPGSAERPGVLMESMHYLKKTVAGASLRRPAWFFDVHEHGEGLSDVGTHLVDLVAWALFPEQALDVKGDLILGPHKRWPTLLTQAEFQQITGEADFPAFLQSQLVEGRLPYFCNTQSQYQLRNIHVKLDVLWSYGADAGTGDTHLAIFQGTRSAIEIRQGAEEHFKPELYVVPVRAEDKAKVAAALSHKVEALQKDYPGVGWQDQGTRFWVNIPESYRIGHEAHFGEVMRQFLRYVRRQEPLPAWEKPNMLAKYEVTTRGVALARTDLPE